MSAYKLHKEFRFTVCGEEFAITSRGDTCLTIKETRKNGQEDCRMSGELLLHEGKWEWDKEWGRWSFDKYGNDGVADAIPAYINANPLP